LLACLGGGQPNASGQGTKLPIQQAIEARYVLSKPTADHKDLVEPGVVVDLLKDDLLMSSVALPGVANSTYKDGHFEASGLSRFNNHFAKLSSVTASNNRTFVAGEKFWLIGVEVRNEGAVLEFLSDEIQGIRYRAYVKYPFAKGEIPAPDHVIEQINESIKAEPINTAGDQSAQQMVAAPPAAPPAAMAAIPPPPAPTDMPPATPKTISLGQTKDEVAANFGVPTKIVTLATKEIDYYPDMKVTFVKGKVADVQ
jgi:hypothetical protein